MGLVSSETAQALQRTARYLHQLLFANCNYPDKMGAGFVQCLLFRYATRSASTLISSLKGRGNNLNLGRQVRRVSATWNWACSLSVSLILLILWLQFSLLPNAISAGPVISRGLPHGVIRYRNIDVTWTWGYHLPSTEGPVYLWWLKNVVSRYNFLFSFFGVFICPWNFLVKLNLNGHGAAVAM